MYEFWYNYITPKFQNNEKLCYMDTGSFIINIRTKYFNEDIPNDVDERFDTSIYECAYWIKKQKSCWSYER